VVVVSPELVVASPGPRVVVVSEVDVVSSGSALEVVVPASPEQADTNKTSNHTAIDVFMGIKLDEEGFMGNKEDRMGEDYTQLRCQIRSSISHTPPCSIPGR
jgi:hypothetical protein